MTLIKRFLALAVVTMALLSAAPVMAQTANAQADQGAANTQAPADFSQEQLHNFADANSEIRDIRQTAIKKMKQTDDQGERTQLRKQAQNDMLAAIKDAGITLQQYNAIGHAVQSNPQLAQKIEQMQ